ncbi:MAG: cyclic nucleotide-binding domain-containing protein [Nitrospinae bacterium]|nr:cyclic nucleotide-binding domain-containing protein [Nitrospinota bacterium]
MKLNGAEREKWVALLMGVKFFADFSYEELGSLLDAGEVRHYKIHDFVIKENEETETSTFFVILRGSVKVLKNDHFHQKKELVTIQAGDCFGEMAFLLNAPRTASILAVEDSYIFRVSSKAADSMNDPSRVKLYRQFAISLAERLSRTG